MKCFIKIYSKPQLLKSWIALSIGLITIQWISIRQTNCTIHWKEIYPLNSAIHLLNNWGLFIKFSAFPLWRLFEGGVYFEINDHSYSKPLKCYLKEKDVLKFQCLAFFAEIETRV